MHARNLQFAYSQSHVRATDQKHGNQQKRDTTDPINSIETGTSEDLLSSTEQVNSTPVDEDKTLWKVVQLLWMRVGVFYRTLFAYSNRDLIAFGPR